MHTFDVRTLAGSEVNGDDLVQWMLGNRVTRPTIFGAVLLDADNIPIAPIPVKGGVKWEGWPMSDPGVTYSMSTPNEGPPPGGKTRQPVTVYERRDGFTTVVARVDNAVVVTKHEPMPVKVQAPDRSKWYGTYGLWTAIEGLWVIAARAESA